MRYDFYKDIYVCISVGASVLWYTCEVSIYMYNSQELVLCFHYGFRDSNADQWALPAEPWIHLVDICCVMFFTLLGL